MTRKHQARRTLRHKNRLLQVDGRPARGEKSSASLLPDLRTSVHPSAHALDVPFSDRSQTAHSTLRHRPPSPLLAGRSGIGLPRHSLVVAQASSDASSHIHPRANRITFLLKIFRIRWGLIQKPVIMMQPFSVCSMIYGEIPP